MYGFAAKGIDTDSCSSAISNTPSAPDCQNDLAQANRTFRGLRFIEERTPLKQLMRLVHPGQCEIIRSKDSSGSWTKHWSDRTRKVPRRLTSVARCLRPRLMELISFLRPSR